LAKRNCFGGGGWRQTVPTLFLCPMRALIKKNEFKYPKLAIENCDLISLKIVKIKKSLLEHIECSNQKPKLFPTHFWILSNFWHIPQKQFYNEYNTFIN